MFLFGPLFWIICGIGMIMAEFKMGGLVLTLISAIFEALGNFIKGLLGVGN